MIDSPDHYVKSAEEMMGLFIQTPEAISNTVKIADMCNLEIQLGKWIMPVFDVPGGKTPAEYIQTKVKEGLIARYGKLHRRLRKE